jgi:hypothetical protein
VVGGWASPADVRLNCLQSSRSSRNRQRSKIFKCNQGSGAGFPSLIRAPSPVIEISVESVPHVLKAVSKGTRLSPFRKPIVEQRVYFPIGGTPGCSEAECGCPLPHTHRAKKYPTRTIASERRTCVPIVRAYSLFVSLFRPIRVMCCRKGPEQPARVRPRVAGRETWAVQARRCGRGWSGG